MQLENRSLDAEYVGLMHLIHNEDIAGHIYRGFTVLKKEDNTPIRSIEVNKKIDDYNFIR